MRKDAWTEREDQFIKDNYLTMPYRDIAAKLGRTEWAVQFHATKIGCRKMTKVKKINEKTKEWQYNRIPSTIAVQNMAESVEIILDMLNRAKKISPCLQTAKDRLQWDYNRYKLAVVADGPDSSKQRRCWVD